MLEAERAAEEAEDAAEMRFARGMARYRETKESEASAEAAVAAKKAAEDKLAMGAALCRLFDEYKQSFWNGPNGSVNELHITTAQRSTTSVLWRKNVSFPEQSSYAHAMYGDSVGYKPYQFDFNYPITLPVDKVKIMLFIVNRIIEAHVAYDARSMKQKYNQEPAIESGAAMLHNGKVYVELFRPSMPSLYIDPSICPDYSVVDMSHERPSKACYMNGCSGFVALSAA